MEDYLEAILLLVRRGRVARVRDIAKHLGVGMPSVTAAMKTLSRRNLVNYDPYEVITLTDVGRDKAGEINHRHRVIREFLTEVLALDGASAEANACRMEHAVDVDFLERLQLFLDFTQRRTTDGNDWIGQFQEFYRNAATLSKTSDSDENGGDMSDTGTTEEDRSAGIKTLADFKPPQKVRIVRISGATAANRRLVEMGLTKGTIVSVLRVAPLGDPFEIKVRGYNLSLRKAEARGIEAQEVPQ